MGRTAMVTAGPADFGSKMRRAREQRGISLRQIASRTKISPLALEALERNDISRLPGGIFSRAFVRSYAIEVGLDPEATVCEFLAQFPHESVTAGSPHVPQEDHAAIESERQSAQAAFKLAAISLPLIAAIIYATLGGEPASESAPSPEPPAAVAGSTPLAFELVGIAPVALEIEVDGVRRGPSSLDAGQRVAVEVARELSLAVADAGAVQLTINGRPAAPLGVAGEPATIRIDRQNMSTFLAPQ